VFQSVVELSPGEKRAVSAKLSPTQVALKDREVRFAVAARFPDRGAQVEGPLVGLLGQLATVLLSQDGLFRYEIWGYGDSSKVASQRAEAVVAWLVAAGVPAERLVAVGKGSLPDGQRDELRVLLR
jgi:flagellar motor protein MotB